jgi:glycosyltransferase involved in cell wall biosynthesis
VITVSGFIRDILVSSGIAWRKIELIPDGIEIPLDLPDASMRAQARREWGLDSEAFVIGHAGAFTAEKGQDVLLQAFLQAAAVMPGAQLLLAGVGPLRDSPKFSALLGKAQGRARLLGWMEDLTPFFAAIDLYVMPSRAEGLGSSALLAMAHGLPVAASRVGGLSEVVEEGRTGWLVPPDSPPAFAEILVTVASDRDRLRRWGLRGRERACAFGSDIMVSRTEALYRRLMGLTEGTGNRGLGAVRSRDRP